MLQAEHLAAKRPLAKARALFFLVRSALLHEPHMAHRNAPRIALRFYIYCVSHVWDLGCAILDIHTNLQADMLKGMFVNAVRHGVAIALLAAFLCFLAVGNGRCAPTAESIRQQEQIVRGEEERQHQQQHQRLRLPHQQRQRKQQGRNTDQRGSARRHRGR